MRPIEAQSNAIKSQDEDLVREIALIKEKEAKLEERENKLEEKQLKNESIFKKKFEKFPDLAGLT